MSMTKRHLVFILGLYKNPNLSPSDRILVHEIAEHIGREASQLQGVISRLSPRAIELIDQEIEKKGWVV